MKFVIISVYHNILRTPNSQLAEGEVRVLNLMNGGVHQSKGD